MSTETARKNLPRTIQVLGVCSALALGQILLSQSNRPAALPLGLLLFGLAAWGFLRGTDGNDRPTDGFSSPGVEALAVGTTFLVAAYFRLHLLSSFPSGIFLDTGVVGIGGLRVLHEGWRPMFESELALHPGLVFYLSAAWHLLFPSTQHSLALYHVVISSAALLLAYGWLRELAGPRTACLVLFFLAISRWDAFYARWAHAAVLQNFFLNGALWCWLWGRRTGRGFPHLAAAFFLGAGMYTYHGFKIIPFVFAVFAFYEARVHAESWKRDRRIVASASVFFLLLCAPMLWHWIRQGTVGRYEMGMFVVPRLFEPGGWTFLGQLLLKTFLMFNRQGDLYTLHNLRGLPMLDAWTGALWMLGLTVLALRTKGRLRFYALAGAVLLSLNCLLAGEPAHANRMWSMLPFVLLMSALGWRHLLTWVFRTVSAGRSARWLVWFLVLGAACWQNHRILFRDQPNDSDTWRLFDIETTRIGQKIAAEGAWEYKVASRYAAHLTLRYLAYSHRERYEPLRWPENLVPAAIRGGAQGICFILDEGKTAVRDMIASRYPQCRWEYLRSPEGRILLSFGYVDREEWERVRAESQKTPRRRPKHWSGIYRRSPGGPALTREEPVLNFTYRTDFPSSQPPLSAEWKARVRIPTSGKIGWMALTEREDQAEIWVDGRRIAGPGPVPQGVAGLAAGAHSVRVRFRMGEGPYSSMSLAWKLPGTSSWTIVPQGALEYSVP